MKHQPGKIYAAENSVCKKHFCTFYINITQNNHEVKTARGHNQKQFFSSNAEDYEMKLDLHSEMFILIISIELCSYGKPKVKYIYIRRINFKQI